ncbi:MAG: hypothetical protein NZM11_05300 [Anaerolineales bacterium]|nr:hypothetical protein [Anaerolineales bacterium]
MAVAVGAPLIVASGVAVAIVGADVNSGVCGVAEKRTVVGKVVGEISTGVIVGEGEGEEAGAASVGLSAGLSAATAVTPFGVSVNPTGVAAERVIRLTTITVERTTIAIGAANPIAKPTMMVGLVWGF